MEQQARDFIEQTTGAPTAGSVYWQKAGVDLYELMCQARQPEHKAEAKKAFIQAIDSVEDGLYRKLRELQYTNEDFLKGLDHIQSVIARSEVMTD